MGFLGSLFKKLTGGIPCPACGTPGAQKEGERIRCLNPLCQNFDTARGEQSGTPTQPPAPVPPRTSAASPSQGPSAHSMGGKVSIHYNNYKGESKTFVADAGSIRREHNHIIAKVAPKGATLALSRDRIQNLGEIDFFLPPKDRSDKPQPTARERQVLGYHKKYGTTSPFYEKIRAKYPDW